jgi:hypothetical protein
MSPASLPSAASPVERFETAAARWYAEERQATRPARIPGPLPTSLALLPLVVLSLAIRFGAPDVQTHASAEPSILLDVLVTDTGYQLRITDVTQEGWPHPQRVASVVPLLEARRTFVYRVDGQDPSGPLLAAAVDLLAPTGEARPRVWLRADDAIPWDQVLTAGQALEPLKGGDLPENSGPLARVSLDVRP